MDILVEALIAVVIFLGGVWVALLGFRYGSDNKK